jgi:predicted ATPase/DNA-binding winged helix-turn-helix (wHTH) protein
MSSSRPSIRFGRFELRPAQRSLLVDGHPANLGARAFDMLEQLIERRHRVVGSAELIALVWPGLVVEENNLRQQIAALRKLLGATAIVTVPGRGYRFALALEDNPHDTPDAVTPSDRTSPSSNLPLNLPDLIGREDELAAVTALLADTHLLTLVGAGGVGKTRFALEVAAQIQGQCKDGVWFVELAPVADPALVPQAVAAALGVHEEPGRPLADTLLDFLRCRELLIVLDNCEHLVEACAAWVERVLHACAAVRTLATSREPLDIEGESAWRMPSLRAAQPDMALSAEQLMAYPATRLFVQRAAAAAPTFRVTADNAAAVASICHHLDGIPLALELAAARVKAMRVEQVDERLRDRFALLTRGSRTASARHQTLRSLIDWSHDLLPHPEQVLLRRLSIFAGGWTLESAEAVCSGNGLPSADVLDLMTRLAEKSLVSLDEQSAEPRYRMLETIRQYGIERLIAAGEAEAIRIRHLSHFAEFAEGIQPKMHRRDEPRWLAVADAELDNTRAALSASLQPGHAELGLRLLNALQRFWYTRMYWKEAVDWVGRLAERSAADGPPTLHRARSLYVGAIMAYYFDLPTARRLGEECFAMSRELNFDEGAAWALTWFGLLDTRKRDPGTASLFAESLDLGRRIEDPWRAAWQLTQCLVCYAGYEAQMGRYESAEALLSECEVEIAKIGNDTVYLGHCRALQGTMAVRRGEFKRAQTLLDESLALYRAAGSRFDIGGSLAQHGFLALQQGDSMLALQRFRESLQLHRNYPMSPWVTKALAHLLIAFTALEQWTIAAQLAGVVGGADRTATGAPAELSGRAARAYEQAVSRARAVLGDAQFVGASSEGRQLTREQAVALALAE